MLKQWETRVVRLCDVKTQDDNPRVINMQAFEGLVASIDRFGMVDLIVWNKRTGNVVSGHQRLAVLLKKGVTEAPMIVVDMSEEEELAASLTMNNTTIEGQFDEPIFELIGQIKSSAPDLFKAVRIDDLELCLEKSMKKAVLGETVKKDNDWDTECPCCGEKWKVDAKDVIVVNGLG